MNYGIGEEIYRELKENIDIVKCWFDNEGMDLNMEKLFKFEKYEFSPVLNTEEDIYVFFNKLINNVMYGKSFQISNIEYLERNFVEFVRIVIENKLQEKKI